MIPSLATPISKDLRHGWSSACWVRIELLDSDRAHGQIPPNLDNSSPLSVICKVPAYRR